MKVIMCAELSAFSLKDPILAHLRKLGYDVDDLSLREDGSDRTYYEIGELVGKKIQNKEYDFGFVFCGSGMGVCMVANRFEGVYAACTESLQTTIMSRGINNANVLALGVRLIAPQLGCDMAQAFLESKFLDSAPLDISREGLAKCFEEVLKIDHAAHHQ